MSEKHEFLSPEWVEAAKKIREDAPAPASPPAHSVRMNQVITGAPFNDGADIQAHMDTSDGEFKMDLGHVENPDVTVTLDYDTAKAILVEGNPQAGMQAFMAGKIKVEGDMTKIMAMQSGPLDADAMDIANKIREITA